MADCIKTITTHTASQNVALENMNLYLLHTQGEGKKLLLKPFPCAQNFRYLSAGKRSYNASKVNSQGTVRTQVYIVQKITLMLVCYQIMFCYNYKISYYYSFMLQLISRRFDVKGLLTYKLRIKLFLAHSNGRIFVWYIVWWCSL